MSRRRNIRGFCVGLFVVRVDLYETYICSTYMYSGFCEGLCVVDVHLYETHMFVVHTYTQASVRALCRRCAFVRDTYV